MKLIIKNKLPDTPKTKRKIPVACMPGVALPLIMRIIPNARNIVAIKNNEAKLMATHQKITN